MFLSLNPPQMALKTALQSKHLYFPYVFVIDINPEQFGHIALLPNGYNICLLSIFYNLLSLCFSFFCFVYFLAVSSNRLKAFFSYTTAGSLTLSARSVAFQICTIFEIHLISPSLQARSFHIRHNAGDFPFSFSYSRFAFDGTIMDSHSNAYALATPQYLSAPCCNRYAGTPYNLDICNLS